MSAVLVIPCYNEADRLPVDALVEFAARHQDIVFLLVDDGSTDGTRAVLKKLAVDNPATFHAMALDHNRGKAEAVRAGMLRAIAMNPDYVGYWDADLSTPLDEIPRFIELYRKIPEKVMLSGARVKLLGKTIERRAVRHYLGRIFATAASFLLDIEMYDTQCGAKLFRRRTGLETLFEVPFHSRWLFDLELIVRIRRQQHGALESSIYEVPLNTWRDMPDSRVKYSDFFLAALDLVILRLRA